MALKKYTALYKLQDELLELLNSIEGDYYLTGGTCLHRYYLNLRYSDDLNLFYLDPNLFREYIREVKEKITNDGYQMQLLIDTRDFTRMMINDNLKINLVNDRTYRYGKTVLYENRIKIDNKDNILANKITAIVGRDEPKDVFDFIALVSSAQFNWEIILEAALKKCFFDKENLINRLNCFPVELFNNIHFINRFQLNELKEMLNYSITALLSGGMNVPLNPNQE